MSDRLPLIRDRSASSAVEFAIIASVFIPLCLGAMDAGLLLWTKGILQSTAARAARCSAIGPTACSDVQQFAVTTAENWAFPGIIAKADVAQPVSVCVSGAQAVKITITCAYWAGAIMPVPFASKTLTAVAYFPTATSCTA
jgi:Flp pilus assembly protein TadG